MSSFRATTLLRSHYAGDWVIPSQEERNDLDKMNALGRAYATAPDGADKENKLFAIQEAFHGYLMKYLVMILRGTIPPGGSRAGRESHVFLRMLMPRGAEPTSDEYSESCKKLHLAFKKDTTEDVYDTLVFCFLRACRRFDPHYADKVRQVCEVIDALSGQFTAEQVTARVGFDSSRILRSLVRKEFLSSVTGKKKVVGYKRAVWPAPASFFESGPVGFVYALQTWFRYFLNEYISKQISQSSEGVIVCARSGCHFCPRPVCTLCHSLRPAYPHGVHDLTLGDSLPSTKAVPRTGFCEC